MKRHSAKPSKLLQGLLGIKKPTRAEKYQAVLAGDFKSVHWLHFDREGFDDHLELVLQLCRDRAPRDLFRRLVVDILVKNPPRMRYSTPGSRELLQEIFAYAAFDLPEAFPDSVTLWRGASGDRPELAAAGYFWSPDRDTAMTYAIENSIVTKTPPLLVKAQVRRSEITAVLTVSDRTFSGDVSLAGDGFDNPWTENNESVEVILLTPPEAVVDPYENWSPRLKEMLRQEIAKRSNAVKNLNTTLADARAHIRKRMREVGYQP